MLYINIVLIFVQVSECVHSISTRI